MKHIKTKILINVSSEKIWQILMDFDNYPNWNPFIKYIQKSKSDSSKLEIEIQPPNGNKMRFKPIIIDQIQNKKFSWKGKLLLSGLFDGEHIFELIANSDGSTTFIHSEKFSGILVPFINLKSTKKGFVLMNQKLKQLAEI